MSSDTGPFRIQIYQTDTHPQKAKEEDISLVEIPPGNDPRALLPRVIEGTTDIFGPEDSRSHPMEVDFTFSIQPAGLAPEVCATISYRVFQIVHSEEKYGLVAILVPRSCSTEIFETLYLQEFTSLQQRERPVIDTGKYKNISLLVTH